MFYNAEKLLDMLRHHNFVNVVKHSIPETGTVELEFARVNTSVKVGKEVLFTVTRKSSASISEYAVHENIQESEKRIINESSYIGIWDMLEECFEVMPDRIYNGEVVFVIDLCGGNVCDAYWKNKVQVKR